MPVGMHYGVFRISGGSLAPLTRKQGFATEYRNMAAARAQQQIVALAEDQR
jgi:hypothetical protein